MFYLQYEYTFNRVYHSSRYLAWCTYSTKEITITVRTALDHIVKDLPLGLRIISRSMPFSCALHDQSIAECEPWFPFDSLFSSIDWLVLFAVKAIAKTVRQHLIAELLMRFRFAFFYYLSNFWAMRS